MKKTAVRLALTAVLLLGLTTLVLLLTRADGRSSTPARDFLTAPIKRGTLERTVSSTGTLAAVETVEVGTEVSGTIEKVLVDFNDQVKAGQVLASIRPDLFLAAVADGEATVARMEADLKLTERELDRSASLFKKGYLSEQEFLPYQVDAYKARASLASAQATLAKAQINLKNTVVRSPIEGKVIQRSVDAGQTVAASLNTPTLFVIARDLGRMQIEADVDETDIGAIRKGGTVRFSVQTYPDRTFSGTVRQIRLQPRTVQNVVTYTVIVEAANDEGLLLPGMTATVDFIQERVENALLVPSAALEFKPQEGSSPAPPIGDGKVRLYVLDPQGGLQAIPVEKGSSDGQFTVIRGESLSEGEEVVTGIRPDAEKGDKKSFSLLQMMRGGPGGPSR